MINTMKSLLALCLFYSAASVSTAETPIKHTSFRPGEIWTDNNGAHINAHGGGILYDKGTYYWYGEHKVEGDAGNYAQVGVHCYSCLLYTSIFFNLKRILSQTRCPDLP